MIQSHIALILYVTGGITASMVLQFLMPRFYLKTFNQLEVTDEVALFFARFWALMVGLMGGLLIWAGLEPALRVPVMLAAGTGKAIFVATLIVNLKGFARGYLLVVIFDALCVLLYGLYLLGF